MNTTETILTRRSVRKFKPGETITREQLKTILNAAMHAPSARNSRPWDFIVVDEPEMLRKIYEVYGQPHFAQASAVIIVMCVPERQVNFCEGNHLNDAGAATENLILQAWDMGIGSVWCGAYPVEERMDGLKALFGYGDEVFPLCAVALGIPDETPSEKGKYEEEKVHWNRW